MTGKLKVKGYHLKKYAQSYHEQGFAPIFMPVGEKNPGYEGWNATRYTAEDLAQIPDDYNANIGLLLGEPSNGLIDVDLDVPEAVTVADSFLRPTAASGRDASPRSHLFYLSPNATTTKWQDTDGKMLVELRSTGTQTLVEPSKHPSGDQYRWDRRSESEPTEIPHEELEERCKKVATATLIARHLPPIGGRHDFALALAGYMLRPRRFDKETTEEILLKAWGAVEADSRDAVKDIQGIVRDTARKIDEGERVVGGPTLESIAPSVPKLLSKWWGWGREAESSEPKRSMTPPDPVTVLPPVPPFPLDALPVTMRNLVEEAAASVVCPPEFIAVPMLATLGAAIGNSYELEVKKSWKENTTLYAAIVADPGKKKSPAAAKAYAPARKKQRDLKRQYDRDMERYRSEKAQWEVDKKEARENGEPVPDPPEEPTMRRTVVNDATIEALVALLEENPRGILCTQDELSGWMKNMDQYKAGGKGSERQQHLSIWAKEPIYVDRKGQKEPHIVDRPLVVLSGTIQPSILPELGSNREDGLLDRFLLSYPEKMSSRWSDDEINDDTAEAYQKLYDALYDLPLGRDKDGELAPKRLQFTDGGREIFIREHNALEEEMERAGFPDHLKGPQAKLQGYLARISLILAVVRIHEPGSVPSRTMAVTDADVNAAAKIIHYFKANARKAYAKLYGENPEFLRLLSLDEFLVEQGGYWEGTTSKLYEILKERSAPGLPGGPVPFGKWLRTLTDEDGVSVGTGDRGKDHIVKLRRIVAEALDNAVTAVGADETGTGDQKHEVTPNTKTSGGTEVAESTEGSVESVEANDVDFGVAEVEEAYGLRPPEPVLDPETLEAIKAAFYDEEVEDFDEDEIGQVLDVLHQRPEYGYREAQELIDEGIFYDLDFEPSRGEVEEAQGRKLGGSDLQAVS